MKTLRTLKINFKSSKFKAFVYSLISLLIIAAAIILGVFYGINRSESKPINNEVKPAIENKPKPNDPHLIKEKIKVVDKDNKTTEVDVDVDKINKIGNKEIVIDDEGNKKLIDDKNNLTLIESDKKLKEENKHLNNDAEAKNDNEVYEETIAEKPQKETESIEVNKESTTNTENEKLNEKIESSETADEGYYEDENGTKIKLQRFNIVDTLSESKELYDLLNLNDLLNQPEIIAITETSDPNVYNHKTIRLSFSEKEFITKFENIIKNALKKFDAFKHNVDLFSFDIKYKFINDNKTILVIINWYYNNYSDSNRVRYFDELSIDYEGR